MSEIILDKRKLFAEASTDRSQIEKARTIGFMFLLAFLFYGIGRSLFESDVMNQKYIGASLIGLNSIFVILIGLFLRSTINKFSKEVGNFYFFARIVEAVGLVSIVPNLFLNTAISNDLGYFIAMFFLGIGSIPMLYVFIQHKVIPQWLSIWGLIGYSLFSFGFFMEFFGKEWSMYLLILAGLWEVAFAFWLIIIGNRLPKAH